MLLLKNKAIGYQCMLAVIAGVLIGVSTVIPLLWPCVFAGIAMLIMLIKKAQTLQAAFLNGYVCGVTAMLFLFLSVIAVLPFDWFGIDNTVVQVIAVGGSWIAIASILAITIAVFAVLARLLSTGTWFDLLLLSSLWVGCEWAASYLYYYVMLGPGSLSGPHFTLTYIGYALANDTVLLQAAALGGVYLLSFMVVWVGVLIERFLNQTSHGHSLYKIALCALVGVWLATHGYFFFAHSTPSDQLQKSVATAVISRYMPPKLNQSKESQEQYFAELHALIKPLQDVDVLVFPENATFLRSLYSANATEVRNTLQAIGKGGETPLVIDSQDILDSDGEVHSQVSFYEDGKTAFSEKQYLMVIGEYMPYLYQGIAELAGGAHLLQTINDVRGYVPGTEVHQALIYGVRIAVRFCDEIMSPKLFSAQVRNGAHMLVNISSLSWFHGSPIVYEQIQRIAKVRAAETGRWLVQSGNMSPAFVLDHYGRVVAETAWRKNEILKVDIPARNTQTLYVLWGSWVLYVSGYLVAVGAYRKLRYRTK